MEHEKFILPLHLGSLESLRIPGCRDLFVISRRVRECPEHPAALSGAGPHLRGRPPPHVPDLPGSGQLFHVLPLLRAGRQSQLPGGGLLGPVTHSVFQSPPSCSPHLPRERRPESYPHPSDPSAGPKAGAGSVGSWGFVHSGRREQQQRW